MAEPTPPNKPPNKDEFISPRYPYWGEVKPQNLVFDANLQEFSNKVSLICSLETGGKITPEEAYRQIKKLWKQLKQTKKAILDDPQWKESPPDLPEE